MSEAGWQRKTILRFAGTHIRYAAESIGKQKDGLEAAQVDLAWMIDDVRNQEHEGPQISYAEIEREACMYPGEAKRLVKKYLG